MADIRFDDEMLDVCRCCTTAWLAGFWWRSAKERAGAWDRRALRLLVQLLGPGWGNRCGLTPTTGGPAGGLVGCPLPVRHQSFRPNPGRLPEGIDGSGVFAG